MKRYAAIRGEKVFSEGRYARSRYGSNSLYRVLTAGDIVKYTDEDRKKSIEKHPTNYWAHVIPGHIKFQKNVTLQRVAYAGRNYYQEAPSKRVVLLTETNYHIYRPVEQVDPKINYILVHGTKDLFLEKITGIDLSNIHYPVRLIDLNTRRCLYNGVWHDLESREEINSP